MKLPEGFKQFWRLYPKKKSQGAAYREWVKQDLELISDEVLAGLKSHKFADEAMWIPNPENWLKSWAWLDEDTEASSDDKALREAMR